MNGAVSFKNLIKKYLDYRESIHLSRNTVRNDRYYLTFFKKWCGKRKIKHPAAITSDILDKYSLYLCSCSTKTGTFLQPRTRAYLCTVLKSFFTWLAKQNYLPINPAWKLTIPQYNRPLPASVLTSNEVDSIMERPDLTTVIGIRDRTILEVLYATGIRRREAANLKTSDIHTSSGVLFIHQGKGKKDRIVPLGDRAALWLDRYIHHARPGFIRDHDTHDLFLSHRTGRSLRPGSIGYIVRQYITAAGITRQGACHMFRHSMATGMLEQGADIRHIQEILGHARLTTTQIYTHVTISALQKAHRSYHPFD